jgi:serine/threonine protein kinase
MIAGTLAYMAPEQTGRMNRSIDSRSDLYAYGVTLYELLTGTLPFTATALRMGALPIARLPPPPTERAPGIRTNGAIVMKLLAKTPRAVPDGRGADLRRCLVGGSRRQIDTFTLGAHDTPDRLPIPGRVRTSTRDRDLARLLRRAVARHAGLVLVSDIRYRQVSVVNRVLVSRAAFCLGKDFDRQARHPVYHFGASAFRT